MATDGRTTWYVRSLPTNLAVELTADLGREHVHLVDELHLRHLPGRRLRLVDESAFETSGPHVDMAVAFFLWIDRTRPGVLTGHNK